MPPLSLSAVFRPRTLSKLATLCGVLAVLAASLAVGISSAPPAAAASYRSFMPFRYQTNDNGAIELIGNHNQTCSGTLAGTTPLTCAQLLASNALGHNQTLPMVQLDADNTFTPALPAAITASTTLNSSEADLALPAGSTVLFAGLYWSGFVPANTANRDKVKFMGPGDANYATVTASQMDVSDTAPATPGTRIYYQGFLDVTASIAARGNGKYWVGDIQSAADTNTYAGWSLVVVLQNSIYPVRNLTVFDGFGKVASSVGDTTLDIPVGPFLTPPLGTVNASVGFVAWEGDATITGDKAMIKNGTATAATLNTAFTVLADAASPATDFFNSSIAKNGVNVSARYPNDINNLGTDIDQLALPGILPNSATDATIRLISTGDTYLPGVVTFAVDLYTPSFPSITKTAVDLNGGTTVPGDQVEYTMAITNSGLDPAINTVFSDIIPANTTYVPGSAVVASGVGFPTFDSLNNRVVAPVGIGSTPAAGGTVNPGDTVSIKFRVTVGAAAAGTVVHNQAKVDYTAKTLNKAFTYKSNITDTPVENVADILVVKTASPSPVVAGTNITYNLAVANVGPNAAAATVVTDKLPVGLTFVSASVTGAASGSACTFASPTVSCSLGSLAIGATPNITIVATTDATLVAASSLSNTASISSATLDLNTANNSSAISTPVVALADLGITKTMTPTSPVPGTTATYLITVTNAGPSVGRSVQVTDTLPGGFIATSMIPSVGTCSLATKACSLGDLPVGGAATVAVVGTVTASALGSLTNVASASSSTPDPTPVNTATVISALAPSAELKVAKTAGSARATAGAPLSYTITVENQGPSVSRSVNLTDTLPAGFTATSISSTVGTCVLASTSCALGDLAVGLTTINVTGTVSASFAGTSLTNSAAVTTSTSDPGAQPNAASVITPVDRSADLELVKSVTPSSGLIAGQAVTYTLTVTNHGPSDALAVTISDAMPATIDTLASPDCNVAVSPITCAVGTLASGASLTVTITGNVSAGFSGSFLDNPASVSTTTTDPGVFPNTASVRSTVSSQADVRLTKVAAPDPVVAGTTVVYTLTATNDGPSNAGGVTVDDTLPAGIVPTAATTSGGCTIAPATNSVHCTIGTLTAGASSTVVITATVAPTMTAGPVGNTATVTATTPSDPTLSNNTATFVSTVQRSADVSVSKTPASQSVAAGDVATWMVTASNAGPSTAEGTSVTDTLPAGMTFVAAVGPTGVTCTESSGVISCLLGTLAVGTPISITITARIAASTVSGTTLTNKVAATSATPDANTANNAASAAVTTTASADLIVTKSVSPASVQAGGAAVWTIVVTNNGPSDAQSVSVTDSLPSGFTVSGLSTSLGSCTLATATCAVGTLAAGSSATLQMTGTVATSYSAPTMSNSATATSTTADPVAGNNIGRAVATVTTLADLKVSKSASPNPVVAGDPLTYTITLTNGGPSSASNVVLTDPLPAGFTATLPAPSGCTISAAAVLNCTYATLAPGVPVVVTVNGLLGSAVAPGPMTNTASATSSTPEANPADNVSTAVVQVTAKADLGIAKAANTSPAFVGDVFGWTISVNNSGPSTSRNVLVTDPLPASIIASSVVATSSSGSCSVSGATVTCALGDMAAGGSAVVKIEGQIDPAATGAALANTATVSSSTADPVATNDSATATVPMERVANVRLTKTATPASVRAGNSITWTITAINAGPSTAEAAQIVDSLPADVTGAVFTPSQGTCAGDTCSLGVIPPNASATVTVSATITAGYAASSVNNTATESSTTPDSTTADNTASVSTPIVREADLAVAKSVSPTTLVAGQPATYRIDVTNAGPSNATSVITSDVMPSGVTFTSATASVGGPCSYIAATRIVQCPIGTVVPGGTPFVTIVAVVDAAQTPGSTIANSATIASATTDPASSNNSATITSPVTTSANLSIAKAANPSTFVPGAAATYTIVVTNAGPSVASDVQVGDAVPTGFTVTGATSTFGTCTTGGTVGCQLGGLPVGQSATITISGTVDAAQTAALVNTATLTSSTPDPTPTDHSATVTTPVAPSADLRIVKTVDKTSLNAGEALRYTLVVTNDGLSVAKAVNVDETPPAGITIAAISTPVGSCSVVPAGRRCSLGDLAPGATVTISVTATVDASTAAGTLTNTAVVSSSTTDPVATNNSGTAAVTVAVAADVAVTKTMTPTSLVAGQPVTYTLTVVNHGPSIATGVVLSDPMPVGITASTATGVTGCVVGGTVTCPVGTLAVGASATITITANVGAAATAGTSVNTATITSTSPDPASANNSSATTANLTNAADVSITKTASPNPVIAGNVITYTLTTHNAGPSDASAVVVSDTLPAGITPSAASWPAGSCTLTGRDVACAIGTVANGATVVVTITATVGAAVSIGNVANTASVSSATLDPSPGNNSATVSSAINRSADLTATKTVSSASVAAGTSVTYHLSVTNHGPSTAEAAQLRDAIPTGMTIVAATAVSPAGASCAIAGNDVTCDVGTLAPGAVATADIVVHVDAATPAGTLTNAATASSATPDPTPADNTASVPVAVTVSTDLKVTKTASVTSLRAGEPLSWTVTVVNLGPSDAHTVTVTDAIPTGFTVASISPSTGTCAAAVCTVPTLAAGSSMTLILSGNVASGVPSSSLANSATATSATQERDPSDNTASASLAVATVADLHLVKSAAPASAVVAGQTITWTVTVRNDGPSDAVAATVTDLLPSGVLGAVATPSSGSCSASVCALGTIIAGATATIAIVGTVDPTYSSATIANSASVSSTTTDDDPTDNAAAVSTPVTTSADLSLTKTGPATVVAGMPISWTVVVHNAGPSTARGVIVGDPIPAGVTGLTTTASQGSCSGQISCVLGDVAAGTDVTITVSGMVDGAIVGSLTNSATVASPTPDPDETDRTGSVTTAVTASADIRVVKTATPNPVRAGESITWTVTVTNLGPSDAQGVVVNETLPPASPSATLITTQGSCSGTDCSLGTVAAGTSVTITVRGVVDATTVVGPMTNSATATSTTPDPVPGNETGSVTSDVVRAADLSIVKSASPEPVRAGDAVTYTLTVTNAGPSTSEGVTVTDTIPAGITFASLPAGCTSSLTTITCDAGTLAVGSTTTITLMGTMDAALPLGSTVPNTALVSAATADPDSGNNQSTATSTLDTAADLRITKSVSPSPLVPGGAATYRIVVTNSGPSVARSVNVSDALPAEFSSTGASLPVVGCTGTTLINCDLGDLAPGASVTVEIPGVIDANAMTDISNTATVSSPTFDPAPSDNSATVTTPVAPRAEIVVTKEVVTTPVVAGQPVTFRVTVRNDGPSTARTVEVVDTLLAPLQFSSISTTLGTCAEVATVVGCSLGDLAPHVSAVITIVTNLPSGASIALEGGPLGNTAQATTTTTQSELANDTASVSVVVDAVADLRITKTVSPNPIPAGGAATYHFTVTNDGPSDAVDVKLTDTFPADIVPGTPSDAHCGVVVDAMSCSYSVVAVGETITLTVPVAAAATLGLGAVENSATVTSPTDPAGPKTATIRSNVLSAADLAVTKSVTPGTRNAGARVVYTINVANNGPADAANATITDTIPTGLSFDPASPPVFTSGVGQCTVVLQTMTCTTGIAGGAGPILNVGATDTIQVAVLIDPSTPAGTLLNEAHVSSTTEDPTDSNNTGSASLIVTRSADLVITKTAVSDIAIAGSTVAWDIEVVNVGPSTAEGVTITDALPVGTRFLSAMATNGAATCTEVSNVITCDLATMLVEDVVDITIVANVDDGVALGSTIENAASVSSLTPDPDPSNNDASAPVSIDTLVDLELVKTVDAATVRAGEGLVYAVTVTNHGPSAATNVVVLDALATDVTAGAPSPSVGTCDPVVSGAVRCVVPTLGSGESVTVHIPVTVSSLLAPGPLFNTASVVSDTAEYIGPDDYSNAGSASTDVTAAASLSLAKVANTPVFVAGATVSWTVTVTNAGPSAAQSVQLTDAVPIGVSSVSGIASQGTCAAASCDLGTVDAGASALVTFTGTLAANVVATSLANTASATSPTDVGPPATASVTTPVAARADVSIVKSSTPATVIAGQSITWTITISNAGPSDAQSVNVADVLPADVAITSVVPSQGSCTASVTCVIGTIPANGTATVTVAGIVNSDIASTFVANTATASSPTPDPDTADRTATVTTPVTTQADLVVTKTATTVPMVPGMPVGWVITVVNNGPSTARYLELVDALPTALISGTLLTPSQGTCDELAKCLLGDLSAGATATVAVTAILNANVTSATITNDVIVTTTTNDPTPNTATAVAPVTPSADLHISKSGAPDPVVAGQSVTWTIEVRNDGPSDSSNVVVHDDMPAALTVTNAGGCTVPVIDTGLDCLLGTVANGTTKTVTIVALVPADATFTTVANSATVLSATTDPDPTDNSTSASVAVSRSANVSVAKSVNPTSVVAGRAVSWTITVTNAGPSLARAVVVSDVIPAGVTNVAVTPSAGTCNLTASSVSCNVGDLAAGGAAATATVTVTADVLANYVAGSLDNQANASSTTPDPTPNNVAVVRAPATASADLSVRKSAPASVIAGQPVTWTIVVTNAGPSDAQAVQLNDVVPAGITNVIASTTQGACSGTLHCELATVTPLTPVTITVTGDLAASFAAATLMNTATVMSTTADPDSADLTSTATSEVVTQADLHVTKAVAPSPAVPGQSITWVVTVSNLGPSTARSVDLTESLPAGIHGVTLTPGQGTCTIAGLCHLGDIVPGTTASITVNATVDADRTAALINTASVTSATTLLLPADDSVTLTTPVGPQADVSITKTGPTGVVVPGTAVSWTITVTNAGPSVAHGIVVNDPLPAGLRPGATATTAAGTCTITAGNVSCALGALNAGASATVAVSGLLDASYVAASVSNTATVTSPDDTTPGNNTANATIPSTAQADVRVTVTPTAASAVAGTPLGFTITVTNAGVSDAANTVVTFPVPAGYTLASAEGCIVTLGIATCPIGVLAPGSTRTLTLVGNVGSAYLGTSVALTATVTTSTVDVAPDNNAATATVSVTGDATLAIAKTASVATARFGDTVTYTVTLSNAGPSVAPNATITDTMPSSLLPLSATALGGTCTIVGQVVSCVSISLAATDALVATVTAKTVATGSLTNTAVGSATVSGMANSPSASAIVVLPNEARLTITKTASVTKANVGDQVTYSIVVTGQGPDAATDVVVDEAMPAGLSLISAAPTAGTFDQTALQWHVSTLAAGQSETLVLHAKLVAPGSIVNTVRAHAPNVLDAVFEGRASAGVQAVSTPPIKLPISGSSSLVLLEIAAFIVLLGSSLVFVGRRSARRAVSGDRS
jgi:uncharacterized repeat protein (TIGR01451 family)